MFWKKWFRSPAVRELEELAADMQANLENNYKDAAQDSRRRLKEKLDLFQTEGKLSAEDYRRFSVLYTEYTARMTGYKH